MTDLREEYRAELREAEERVGRAQFNLILLSTLEKSFPIGTVVRLTEDKQKLARRYHDYIIRRWAGLEGRVIGYEQDCYQSYAPPILRIRLPDYKGTAEEASLPRDFVEVLEKV